MTSTERTRADLSVPGRRRTALNWWQAALAGAVVATVLNLLIWGVSQIAGVSLAVLESGEEQAVQIGAVAFSSMVPMVAGIVLASVIARWWPGVIRLAQVLGFLFAMGTIGGAFAFAANTATVTVLTLMHLVSGVVVVLALEALRRHVLTGKDGS